jgi:hypothetical protein
MTGWGEAGLKRAFTPSHFRSEVAPIEASLLAIR